MRHDTRATPVIRYGVPVLAALLMGCARSGGGGPTPTPEKSLDGVYEFSASIPAMRQGEQMLRVKGTLSFFDDSLFIQTGPECRHWTPSERYRTPSTDNYSTITCGGASLNFTRKNPLSAQWYTQVQVPKQRNVCVEYEPRARSGNSPRCLRYRPEQYYAWERRSGSVEVKRIN